MRHGASPSNLPVKRAPSAKAERALSGCAPSAQTAGASAQITPELAELLAAEETRLVMEADNVGMEQLVAALMRIRIPPRKRNTKTRKANGTT